MLFLTSLTGLLLLLLRETSAMGPLLAVHIGVVFALFITMPYGKFVHGIYRFVALVRYARERQMMVRRASSAAQSPSSFRDGPKGQARNP
jgi:citrate/tricarballylate utilization protein